MAGTSTSGRLSCDPEEVLDIAKRSAHNLSQMMQKHYLQKCQIALNKKIEALQAKLSKNDISVLADISQINECLFGLEKHVDAFLESHPESEEGSLTKAKLMSRQFDACMGQAQAKI